MRSAGTGATEPAGVRGFPPITTEVLPRTGIMGIPLPVAISTGEAVELPPGHQIRIVTAPPGSHALQGTQDHQGSGVPAVAERTEVPEIPEVTGVQVAAAEVQAVTGVLVAAAEAREASEVLAAAAEARAA